MSTSLLFEKVLSMKRSVTFLAPFSILLWEKVILIHGYMEKIIKRRMCREMLRATCATQKKTRRLPVGISIVETTIQIVIKDHWIMEVFILILVLPTSVSAWKRIRTSVSCDLISLMHYILIIIYCFSCMSASERGASSSWKITSCCACH